MTGQLHISLFTVQLGGVSCPLTYVTMIFTHSLIGTTSIFRTSKVAELHF